MTPNLENPWVRLPLKADFVLESDKDLIEQFNKDASLDTRIVLDQIPEPFLGDARAQLVLLSLNPGRGPDDGPVAFPVLPDNAFGEAALANLRHESIEYPFWPLNPAFANFGGHGWWMRRLRPLIEQFGLLTVARGTLCVEYFPYRSRKFGKAPPLPSQDYGFELVRNAIARDATVVLMRSRRHWEKAVDGLCTHKNYFVLYSNLNPTLSQRNLCPAGWDAVTRTLSM